MYRTYEEIRKQFNIIGPSGDAAITSFSGGNRQKHLLARWMSVETPKILLLAQPAQGVDEAARPISAKPLIPYSRRGFAF